MLIIKNIWVIPVIAGLFTMNCSFAENRALLIGINDYQFVTPKLLGSINDVLKIEKLAHERMGYKKNQVFVLKNEQATRKNILEGIKTKLITETNAGDKVLFYYSGHGFQITDLSGDETDSLDETLVPFDTNHNGTEFTHMISDDELRHLFDQIDDREVTIIIDSCHSGSVTRGINKKNGDVLTKTIRDFKATYRGLDDVTESHDYKKHRKEKPFMESKRNRVVWSAVTAGQLAFVDHTTYPRQGVFTRWLYDGVEKKHADYDGNGVVNNAELLTYTRLKSTEFCKNVPQCNLGLTPTLEVPHELITAAFGQQSELTNPPNSNGVMAENYFPERNKESILIDVAVNGRSTNSIKLKEELSIYIKNKRKGFLLLLDRDKNGKLKQLFPNKSDKNNEVKAGVEIFIPPLSSHYSVKATEVGNSQLIAIVTHDKIELPNIKMNLTKDIIPIAKPEAYLSDIATVLQSTWTDDNVNRQADYSIAKFNYSVSK